MTAVNKTPPQTVWHRLDRFLADIRMVFTGLRAGEKLYEELLFDNDTKLPTSVQRLRIARLDDRGAGELTLAWLAAVADRGGGLRDAEARDALFERVLEYRRAVQAAPPSP